MGEPCLVTFCCLLPYTTHNPKVEIYVRVLMYQRKTKLPSRSFGDDLELLRIFKVQ